jgi:hypothetical protein
VLNGIAKLISHHNSRAYLTLNIGLAVRNSAALDAVIADASNSASPGFGHYLTEALYKAQYAPTDAQVKSVIGRCLGGCHSAPPWRTSESIETTYHSQQGSTDHSRIEDHHRDTEIGLPGSGSGGNPLSYVL